LSCPNELERHDPFDHHYTEGDAWHYRFFVSHNTKRLIELFGGEEIFVNELDTFFTRSQEDTSTILPNPYYWAGNEHDLFSIWQFHYANRFDLTKKHVRWLFDHVYTTKPDGIPGNDDYGTLLLVWVSIHWPVRLLIYSVVLRSIVSPFAVTMVNVH
jgi:putative alpha-1,2-mannosidase